MNSYTKHYRALALMMGGLGLFLFVLLTVAIQSIPAVAQGGITNFDTVVLSGDLTVADDVTLGDDLTLTDMAVMADLRMTEQTGITLTTGGTLTPTGSVQPIRSAGTIAFGAIAGCAAASAGHLLIVENEVNQTITITDSATLRLTGNLALGQFDTVLLFCDGATWVQLSTANN
jgi:hypothetical protein